MIPIVTSPPIVPQNIDTCIVRIVSLNNAPPQVAQKRALYDNASNAVFILFAAFVQLTRKLNYVTDTIISVLILIK